MQFQEIDYSQPGYKEMFANYGLTAIAALSLEKSIWLLVTALDNIGKGSVTLEQIRQEIGKYKKKPMGPLIDALHERFYVSPELSHDLAEAKEKRNFIIHHFFTERVGKLSTNPNQLSNELRPIRDIFISIHHKIDALLNEVISEMNKPYDNIKPELRTRIKVRA